MSVTINDMLKAVGYFNDCDVLSVFPLITWSFGQMKSSVPSYRLLRSSRQRKAHNSTEPPGKGEIRHAFEKAVQVEGRLERSSPNESRRHRVGCRSID